MDYKGDNGKANHHQMPSAVNVERAVLVDLQETVRLRGAGAVRSKDVRLRVANIVLAMAQLRGRV